MSGRRWGLFVVWAVAAGALAWGVLTIDAHVLTVVGLVLLVVAVLASMKTPNAAHTLLGVVAGGVVAMVYALWGAANSEGDSSGNTWPDATFLTLMVVAAALVTAVFAIVEQRARRRP